MTKKRRPTFAEIRYRQRRDDGRLIARYVAKFRRCEISHFELLEKLDQFADRYEGTNWCSTREQPINTKVPA